jgi:hypothetical protein
MWSGKSDLNNKTGLKVMVWFDIKSTNHNLLESILKANSILVKDIQTCQTQFYYSRINIGISKFFSQ